MGAAIRAQTNPGVSEDGTGARPARPGRRGRPATASRDDVLALADGRGVDLVADVVGGRETLAAVRTTAPEGRVLVLGFTAGEIPSIATNRLLLRNVAPKRLRQRRERSYPRHKKAARQKWPANRAGQAPPKQPSKPLVDASYLPK